MTKEGGRDGMADCGESLRFNFLFKENMYGGVSDDNWMAVHRSTASLYEGIDAEM